MKSIFYLLLATSFILTSCDNEEEMVNLNQQAIDTLSNTHWTLTKDVRDGVEQDISAIKNHFHHHGYHLSGNTGDGHTSYIINVDGTDISASADWTYKVDNDGKMMSITTIENTFNGTIIPSGVVYEMTIQELSSTKYVATFTLDGALIERTYEVR